MTLKKCLIIYAFALQALILTSAAHAAVIVQSAAFSGPTGDFVPFGGGFNQFNPSLGTLQSVTLSFSGDLTFFVDFNPTPDACPDDSCEAFHWFSVGFYFNAPGFPSSDDETSDFFNLIDWSYVQPPNDSEIGSGPIGVGYSGSPDNLAGYIGTGTVGVGGLISEDSDECINESTGGGFSDGCYQYDSLNLTTMLTYQYKVPEPLTISLFAVGLAGVLAMRRRRVARAHS